MMSKNVMRPWPCFVLLALACLAGCQSYRPEPLLPGALERDLAVPPDNVLRVRAQDIHHPLLKPLALDYRDGLSPDEAAVLAVLVNPSLRAERDRRALASAQLLTAGILPNPQLTGALDIPTGGNDAGTVNGYNVGLNWDVTSLISRGARQAAASAKVASVDLEVAWQEWQVAQGARTALFDLVALQAQVTQAERVDRTLAGNLAILRRAVEQHQKTVVDLAAAQTAIPGSKALLPRGGEICSESLAEHRQNPGDVCQDPTVPLSPGAGPAAWICTQARADSANYRLANSKKGPPSGRHKAAKRTSNA
jgi:outer membrane protein TolC